MREREKRERETRVLGATKLRKLYMSFLLLQAIAHI